MNNFEKNASNFYNIYEDYDNINIIFKFFFFSYMYILIISFTNKSLF